MRRCAAVLFFFTLILATLTFGQTTADVTLSGQITDSLTHQPIAGAQVSYRAGQDTTSTTSGENGAYSLKAPTRDNPVLIRITQPGYATGGEMLRLKPGVSETHNFELSRSARISGHLLDRDSGNPIAGFYVHATQRIDATGDRLGSNSSSAPSAADGSFAVANLAPGDYSLEIDPPLGKRISFGEKTTGEKKTDDTGYGPTWFPSVPRRDMAVPVSVAANENREIEVRLQKRELHHVAGSLQVPQGMEGDGIWIAVRSQTGMTESELPKAGPFHLDGLEEGNYTLLASTKTTPGHTRVFVSREFDVRDRNIDDLKLAMHPSVVLRAFVKMAEENVDPPEDVRFEPFSVDGWGPESGTQTPSDHMRVADLPPGQYVPMLTTPAGYAVASVSYNGRTVPPSTAIDVEAPESMVTYVLTTRMGNVSGTVRDRDQKPVPDATVWLLPEPLPEDVEKFFFMQRGGGGTTRADGNGGYRISGLVPGRYRAVAVSGGDRQARDIAFIRDQARSAEAIVVEASMTANLDLRVRQ